MKTKKKGFTVVELVVVISIIAILVLLATSQFTNYIKKAKLTQIKNDIKAVENVIQDYLVKNDELPEYWQTISKDTLNNLAITKKLYNKKGLVDVVEDGIYKKVNKEFVKTKTKSKLNGEFHVNTDGLVYYEDNKLSGENEKLFDREVTTKENNKDKLKILNYDFPNGIYRPGDIIKGKLKIEGIQAGLYTLDANITHAKANLNLKDSKSFDINVGEVKDVTFEYKVTKNDRIGFYNLEVKISDTEEIIRYNMYNNIYIAQNEWEYFYEDDFFENDKEIGGIGKLDPSYVAYDYVMEESGIDYSSIMFNVEPNDNKSGQVGTKLPITYGTYEAKIKVPNSDALLNGFFLYGDDKYNPNINYEIDMEILYYEGKWQLWTTIFNEAHKDYEYDGNEPGVILHKQIPLPFDPSEEFHSYRIDFYKNYVSFALDGKEVSRWNNSFEYGDMHLYSGTFYTHWLTGELSPTPLQMKTQWIRRGYFSK